MELKENARFVIPTKNNKNLFEEFFHKALSLYRNIRSKQTTIAKTANSDNTEIEDELGLGFIRNEDIIYPYVYYHSFKSINILMPSTIEYSIYNILNDIFNEKMKSLLYQPIFRNNIDLYKTLYINSIVYNNGGIIFIDMENPLLLKSKNTKLPIIQHFNNKSEIINLILECIQTSGKKISIDKEFYSNITSNGIFELNDTFNKIFSVFIPTKPDEMSVHSIVKGRIVYTALDQYFKSRNLKLFTIYRYYEKE